MTETTIEKMAGDLGICRFIDEPLLQFNERVVYSAMACWIKAIALDKPVGSSKEEYSGVSRRHMYQRSHEILNAFLKMYPEIRDYFDANGKEEPENILRTRLLRHGDLVNAGFDTNIALTSYHTDYLTNDYEVVYGKMIEGGLMYSGISSLRKQHNTPQTMEPENAKDWFSKFLKEVWWSSDMPVSDAIQYFDPCCRARNNYSAWQNNLPKEYFGVVLARIPININGHEYYLIKPNKKLTHKIDPFLQETGVHIRIMFVLRAAADNRACVSVKQFQDHVAIKLYTWLPANESALLDSYAWPKEKVDERLKWTMSRVIWEYIKTYIMALDIKIMEGTNG